MSVELIGLGMFFLVAAAALLAAALWLLSRVVDAAAFTVGLLWDLTPWERRRARQASQRRVEALNHAQRIRIHIIERKFHHAASVDAALRPSFHDDFNRLAHQWFDEHPEAEELPAGFGDALVQKFRT